MSERDVKIELPADPDAPPKVTVGPTKESAPPPKAPADEEMLPRSFVEEQMHALNVAYMNQLNTQRSKLTAEREAAEKLRAEKAEVEQERNKLQAEIEQLKSTIAARTTTRERQLTELEAMRVELAEANEKTASAQVETAKLETELSRARGDRTDLEREVLTQLVPVLQRHGVECSGDAREVLARAAHIADTQRDAPAAVLRRELEAARLELEKSRAR